MEEKEDIGEISEEFVAASTSSILLLGDAAFVDIVRIIIHHE